jgi:hypothetical protein
MRRVKITWSLLLATWDKFRVKSFKFFKELNKFSNSCKNYSFKMSSCSNLRRLRLKIWRLLNFDNMCKISVISVVFRLLLKRFRFNDCSLSCKFSKPRNRTWVSSGTKFISLMSNVNSWMSRSSHILKYFCSYGFGWNVTHLNTQPEYFRLRDLREGNVLVRFRTWKIWKAFSSEIRINNLRDYWILQTSGGIVRWYECSFRVLSISIEDWMQDWQKNMFSCLGV